MTTRWPQVSNPGGSSTAVPQVDTISTRGEELPTVIDPQREERSEYCKLCDDPACRRIPDLAVADRTPQPLLDTVQKEKRNEERIHTIGVLEVVDKLAKLPASREVSPETFTRMETLIQSFQDFYKFHHLTYHFLQTLLVLLKNLYLLNLLVLLLL